MTKESLVAKTLTKWVNVGTQKTLSHGKERSMGNAEFRCSRLCCVSASPANLVEKNTDIQVPFQTDWVKN